MKIAQNNNCLAPEELNQLIADKKKLIKLIDVRTKEEYDEQHIPGAINSVISQLEQATNLFDKKIIIITVCGKGGGRSMQAAEVLKKLGFENANWLCGGTFGWYNEGVIGNLKIDG